MIRGLTGPPTTLECAPVFRRFALCLLTLLCSPLVGAAESPDMPGYQTVSFEQLAGYAFTPPPFDPVAVEAGNPPTGEEQIPAEIKALSGKKVSVTGYMVPVKLEKGLATEILLMRNTLACCFGGVPNMNEWIVVKMRKGIPPMLDTPLAFSGELKVGAIFENGYLTGLYQMDGEKMTVVSPEK